MLGPHLLRLCPRSDGWQQLQKFSLVVDPQPAGMTHITDLEGNNCIQLWFTNATEKLIIDVQSEVETYQVNPFNYLLEPFTLNLPFDYFSDLFSLLQPYLEPVAATVDPVAIQLAQEILQQVNGNTLSFLSTLNQQIYTHCKHLIRHEGQPWPAGITWTQKQGACRDFVVLFMEVCRAVGLGSRFVSGYQEGDLDSDQRELHAWVEVYLPGGGWRGYDPTHGLAVSDRHIALVASAKPRYCSPVVGATSVVNSGGENSKLLESQLEANIVIKHL